MRYSYEFKKMCIDMYRKGMYPETPEGLSDFRFRKTIRLWFRMEEKHGPEVLKHKNHNNVWEPAEKLELVSQVIAGKSYAEVAIANGLNSSQLYQWVQKYKIEGYNGLVNKKKGRPPKESQIFLSIMLSADCCLPVWCEITAPNLLICKIGAIHTSIA